jgi:hypothetical protein
LEEEEEEEEKEETIIEETFQESDDGIVWRTIRKTTIITPEGQTEKFEVLGGIPPFVWRLSVWYCRVFLQHFWWKLLQFPPCKLLLILFANSVYVYKLFQV